MADANLNILERSLAARHGSCMADTDLRIKSSGAATRHDSQMAVAKPTTINTAKDTRSTGHFLTCTAHKTKGGDKRLAARHGTHMADATINIPDRSLAASHGSCMADTNLHTLNSGVATRHGSQMAVANPIPINSAKSTKGTMHCLTSPRNRDMEATCCCCWARNESSIPFTGKFWNSLPASVFPTSYDLTSF
ncbi:hypothetical protein E2C01_070678 [Portunus trituberculatus]|uniref:Uncharacterized protein n=1 Tax=Portunus trituberculatus TaxID=210409 RepID=A0A5B7I2Y0_PORTR|nr:hypothetical protein [Portunus trituberculatus]